MTHMKTSERKRKLILNMDFQCADLGAYVPSKNMLQRWAKAALETQDLEQSELELVVRVVDELESAELNDKFRGKANPTNVLSFPFSAVTPKPLPILGDIVICASIIDREASAENKNLEAHWAHMVIHGVLHLLGYDHKIPTQASAMERLETLILKKLNFPAPYLLDERN